MNENKPFLIDLGNRIRLRRKEMDLSIAKLAARMEFSIAGLWQIEIGRSDPGASTLWRLSRALRCSVHWIVTGEEIEVANAKTADRIGV